MTGWWSRLSGPQRLDIYFRWGLYMISAAWPLLVSVIAMSVPDPRMAGVVAVLVLSIAQSAACIALVRDAVTTRLGGPPPDRRVVIVAAALTAVGTLAAAWAFPVAAESGAVSAGNPESRKRAGSTNGIGANGQPTPASAGV